MTGFAAADTLVERGCDVLVAGTTVTDERRELLDVIGARLVTADPAGQAAALTAHEPDLVAVAEAMQVPPQELVAARNALEA